MYVQAVSNINKTIFSSVVYATINLGWYTQYIVYNKSIASFELIDCIDKTSPYGLVTVQVIQPQTDGFEEYGHVKLLKLKKYCKENGYLTNHKTPQPRLTAEIIYRFISGNKDFVESHTGLEDVMIEKEILAYCYKKHKKMNGKLWAD